MFAAKLSRAFEEPLYRHELNRPITQQELNHVTHCITIGSNLTSNDVSLLWVKKRALKYHVQLQTSKIPSNLSKYTFLKAKTTSIAH